MSRYGSVTITGPSSSYTDVVQASTAEELKKLFNQALGRIPAGYTVVAIALAGSGDGSFFTITIEAGVNANVSGGITGLSAKFYQASSEQELLRATRNAIPTSGTLADVQVAGGSKGAVFMGMLVSGTVAGGGGGTCLPMTRVMYVDASTTTPLAEQNGSQCTPFAAIQDAIDTIPPYTPPGTIEETVLAAVQWQIYVAPGLYNESLTIPANVGVQIMGLTGVAGTSQFLATGSLPTPVVLFDTGAPAFGNITVAASSVQFGTVSLSGITCGTFGASGTGAVQVSMERCSVGPITMPAGVAISCHLDETFTGDITTDAASSEFFIRNGSDVEDVLLNGGGTITLDDSSARTIAGATGVTVSNDARITVSLTVAGGTVISDSVVALITIGALYGVTIISSRIGLLTTGEGPLTALANTIMDSFSLNWLRRAGNAPDIKSPIQVVADGGTSFEGLVRVASDANVTIARDGVNFWLANYLAMNPALGNLNVNLPPVADWYGPDDLTPTPSPPSANYSRLLFVKNVSAANNVTVTPQGTEWINAGAPGVAITLTPGQSVLLVAEYNTYWETLFWP